MKKETETRDPFKRWADKFQDDAEWDEFQELSDRMDRHEIYAQPEEVVSSTIHLVAACAAYWQMDGGSTRGLEDFLVLQRYGGKEDPANTYDFTFDFHGMGHATITVGHDMTGFDLADLYEYPWELHRVVGYNRLLVSRSDSKPLTDQDLVDIEASVLEDLRYDYCEEELQIYFEAAHDCSFLTFFLSDVEDD